MAGGVREDAVKLLDLVKCGCHHPPTFPSHLHGQSAQQPSGERQLVRVLRAPGGRGTLCHKRRLKGGGGSLEGGVWKAGGGQWRREEQGWWVGGWVGRWKLVLHEQLRAPSSDDRPCVARHASPDGKSDRRAKPCGPTAAALPSSPAEPPAAASRTAAARPHARSTRTHSTAADGGGLGSSTGGESGARGLAGLRQCAAVGERRCWALSWELARSTLFSAPPSSSSSDRPLSLLPCSPAPHRASPGASSGVCLSVGSHWRPVAPPRPRSWASASAAWLASMAQGRAWYATSTLSAGPLADAAAAPSELLPHASSWSSCWSSKSYSVCSGNVYSRRLRGAHKLLALLRPRPSGEAGASSVASSPRGSTDQPCTRCSPSAQQSSTSKRSSLEGEAGGV